MVQLRSSNKVVVARENQKISHMDYFLFSLERQFSPDQIVVSGDDFDLLAKDPAVNSKKPSSFIYPESKEQVQFLVKLALEFNVKLWVYSTGKNWGYLNTSGSENAVVVLLNRMNKIIQVNNELAYAIIEPGVTYQALNHFLSNNNYTLWTDSPGGPPTGSVIGNALDRGVGVTKYGDHFAHLCGYEVVLADGTIINTGTANNEKQGASHLYKWGVGPYVEGLFSQSNFGIVVSAGIWLMRKPEDYALFSLRIKDNHSLAKCMDSVRELMLSGVINEVGRFSNDVAMLTLLTQAVNEGIEPKEAISREELAKLKLKYHVPGWTGTFCIYGHSELVNATVKKTYKNLKKSNTCERINVFTKKKATFLRKIVEMLSKTESPKVHQAADWLLKKCLGSSLALFRLFPGLVDLHEGKPVETVVRRGYFRYQKQRPDKDIHVGRDDIGVLWSVPVLPFKGAEVVSFANECQKLFEKYNFDFYMTTMVFSARSVCPLMVILYDRRDELSCKRAELLYHEILDLSHHLGYQHFRAGINGWKKLYQNCPEMKDLNQKLKMALDPSGVFAPGRYGIE